MIKAANWIRTVPPVEPSMVPIFCKPLYKRGIFFPFIFRLLPDAYPHCITDVNNLTKVYPAKIGERSSYADFCNSDHENRSFHSKNSLL